MINRSTEDGIENFIKYIHRMNKLNYIQLEFLINAQISSNPEKYTSIGIDVKGHIDYIRNMAKYDDNTLRSMLRKSSDEDPIFTEIFEDTTKKKAIKEIGEAAKDIHGDPRTFARKVA